MLESSHGFLDPDKPLPFEHLFVPLVLNARRDLHHRVDPAIHRLLTPEAHAGWERYLVMRLTSTGGKAVYQQFSIFRTVRTAFPRSLIDQRATAAPLYHEFVGENARQRLREIFDCFPVLGALCERICENWVATVTEFLLRLSLDRDHFSTHLDLTQALSQATTIEAGLSDPHRGGRCVARVTFANGGSLLYKPRSLAPESWFASLLGQLNLADIPYPLKAARSWDREDYGWMEEVLFQPCTDLSAVHAFYWRTGALLGLLYLVHGVDFHQGNLIAHGEFPILIDLETLLHPQGHVQGAADHGHPAVLRMGFLPLIAKQKSSPYQWSTLEREELLPSPRSGWFAINRDDMTPDTISSPTRRCVHRPHACGEAHLAGGYVPEIQAGFRWVGNWLFETSNRQNAFEQWLLELSDCPRRRILRPSIWYHELLVRSTRPQCLADRKLYATMWTELASACYPETHEEIRGLEQGDIPYFSQVGAAALDGMQMPTREQFLSQVEIIAESLTPDANVRSTPFAPDHHGGMVEQRIS